MGRLVLCTRLLISPETILRMNRLLQSRGAWTYLDLLLVCCAMPDCDPVVTVDFEDLGDLGDRLARCRSDLLVVNNDNVPEQLEVSPKRLLSSVKGALIMLAWSEVGDAEQVAGQLTCYPNEVTRLRDSTLRLLSGMRALLKESASEESLSGSDSSYLDKKIARLELMIAAGLDEDAATMTLVPGIGRTWARRFVENGVLDIEMLAQADVSQLVLTGPLSSHRAEAWIAKASELLSSDDLWAATDYGALVRVHTAQIEIPVDVYRLKRSWQLRVERSIEPDTFRVTGGSDPHLVRGMPGAWSCDCADRAKGHECKHLIAVRRWNGDAAIRTVDQALLGNSSSADINLRQWWSR